MYVIRKEFSNIFKVLMELNEVSHFKTLTHFSEVHEVENILSSFKLLDLVCAKESIKIIKML